MRSSLTTFTKKVDLVISLVMSLKGLMVVELHTAPTYEALKETGTGIRSYGSVGGGTVG